MSFSAAKEKEQASGSLDLSNKISSHNACSLTLRQRAECHACAPDNRVGRCANTHVVHLVGAQV